MPIISFKPEVAFMTPLQLRLKITTVMTLDLNKLPSSLTLMVPRFVGHLVISCSSSSEKDAHLKFLIRAMHMPNVSLKTFL